jgi:hypothetical protein
MLHGRDERDPASSKATMTVSSRSAEGYRLAISRCIFHLVEQSHVLGGMDTSSSAKGSMAGGVKVGAGLMWFSGFRMALREQESGEQPRVHVWPDLGGCLIQSARL